MPIVRNVGEAFAVITLARSDPPRPETICFVLDPDGDGRVVTVVDGTDDPDDLIDLVDLFSAAAAGGPATRLVAATVRTSVTPAAHDVDLWHRADLTAGRHGVLLVEWFVIDPDAVTVPRRRAGEPSRWPPPPECTRRRA